MAKLKPKVVRGGKANTIGNNLYYMTGRKHSQGGIDIGDNPKTGLEVEGGEVIQTSPSDLKVFSAQPILNGKSPAKLVMGGANPNDVFTAQEDFKRVNGINDDGTNKKAMGGLSRDKDYGSKKKPYPSVAKGDFAGGGRSYPIPTRADAVDALRLAGLHGRSDVKAKVYNKYPDLKKKKVGGRAVIVNGNVSNRLMFGETPIDSPTGGRNKSDSMPRKGGEGSRPKAAAGTKKKVEFDRLNGFDINYSPIINAANSKPNVTRLSPIVNDDDYPSLNARYASEPDKENFFKRNGIDTTDLIGLGGNLAGSIASGIVSRRALNRMEAPKEPRYNQAANLKTNYNIRPQISDIEENVRRTMADIDANTSSSRTALQRKQRTRNAAQYSKNNLYGQKENIETQLINQDRMNRQQVSASNTAAYNDWRNRTAQFNNSIREQKASSLNNIFSGINAGLQDMLGRIENRRNYNNTLGVYDATHPNVDRRLFTSKGVKF